MSLRDNLYELDKGGDNDLRRRVADLENLVASIMGRNVPGSDMLDFRTYDDAGNPRMIMSAISLMEEFGIPGYLAAFDAVLNAQFYVDADTGALMAAGGRFQIDANGLRSDATLIKTNWWKTISAQFSGSASPVILYCMCYDAANGLIYVGGSFSKIDNVTAYNVAKYTIATDTWSPIGSGATTSGTNGAVWGMCLDASGYLVITGEFTNNAAGTLAMNRIGYWNGTTFVAYGTGLNAQGTAVILDGSGNLVVAGTFTTANGVAVNLLARWTGSTFTAYGTGLNVRARALALDSSGNLVVTGDFTTANGVTVNYLAYWTGSTFAAYGTGLNAAGYSLGLDASGNLVVGGDFTTANGVTVNRLAYWNGSTFVAYGTGMNGIVRTIALDSDGNLIVGGNFTTANGVTVGYIAKWTGATFSTFGNGFNEAVYGIKLAGTDLYFVGDFSVIDGHNSQNAALLTASETLENILRYLAAGDRETPQSDLQFSTQWITSVTTAVTMDATFRWGFYRAPTAVNANDGDEYLFQANLAAGTYTLYVYGATSAACGKVDWYLDNADTAFSSAQDWWSAGGALAAEKSIASVVIPSSGRHTLKAKVNGKTGTDYIFACTAIWLVPATYTTPE